MKIIEIRKNNEKYTILIEDLIDPQYQKIYERLEKTFYVEVLYPTDDGGWVAHTKLSKNDKSLINLCGKNEKITSVLITELGYETIGKDVDLSLSELELLKAKIIGLLCQRKEVK